MRLASSLVLWVACFTLSFAQPPAQFTEATRRELYRQLMIASDTLASAPEEIVQYSTSTGECGLAGGYVIWKVEDSAAAIMFSPTPAGIECLRIILTRSHFTAKELQGMAKLLLSGYGSVGKAGRFRMRLTRLDAEEFGKACQPYWVSIDLWPAEGPEISQVVARRTHVIPGKLDEMKQLGDVGVVPMRCFLGLQATGVARSKAERLSVALAKAIARSGAVPGAVDAKIIRVVAGQWHVREEDVLATLKECNDRIRQEKANLDAYGQLDSETRGGWLMQEALVSVILERKEREKQKAQ